MCISLLTQRCPKRICTCFLGPWPSGVRRPWALVRSGGSADQLWRSQGWKGRRRTTTAAAATRRRRTTTTTTTTTTINQNENQIQNYNKKKKINNNNNKQQLRAPGGFKGSLLPNVAFRNQKKIARKAPGRWPKDMLLGCQGRHEGFRGSSGRRGGFKGSLLPNVVF